jgi:TolA-binding protein
VPADVSTLAEQNDQFSQAMIAKRTGDTASALAAFERFLAKHPASSLAENAAAERMTLLAQVDRTSAISAARQYLAKYPSGFARADAQAILALQP